MKVLKDRVADGLLRMNNRPDALLFLGGQNWTYRNQSINGIPVLHTTDLSHLVNFAEADCHFMPIWWKAAEFHALDVARFITGYEEG